MLQGNRTWSQGGVVHRSHVLLACRKFWFCTSRPEQQQIVHTLILIIDNEVAFNGFLEEAATLAANLKASAAFNEYQAEYNSLRQRVAANRADRARLGTARLVGKYPQRARPWKGWLRRMLLENLGDCVSGGACLRRRFHPGKYPARRK
jgi:hypothetical protein